MGVSLLRSAVTKLPIAELSLEEIGVAMNISKERVRQIETKALIMLRNKLRLKDIQNINQIL